MYSNIYQISETPLNHEKWMDVDFLSDSPLLGSVANCIDIVEDRYAALKDFGHWLAEHELGTFANEAFVLSGDGCSAYFLKRYPAFQSALTALQNLTAAQYNNDFNTLYNRITDLEKTVINKYDSYILWDMSYLMPMDEFLRTARPDIPYYVSGICCYKY